MEGGYSNQRRGGGITELLWQFFFISLCSIYISTNFLCYSVIKVHLRSYFVFLIVFIQWSCIFLLSILWALYGLFFYFFFIYLFIVYLYRWPIFMTSNESFHILMRNIKYPIHVNECDNPVVVMCIFFVCVCETVVNREYIVSPRFSAIWKA